MKLTNIVFLLALCCILIHSTDLVGQQLTQTIRGRIIDADTKSPIPFANCVIIDLEPMMGVQSDADGNFKLEAVPVGRVTLRISCIGYEEKTFPHLMIISGKESILDIELTESFHELNEATVSATQHKSEIKNEMAQVSSKGLSVEESKRYAGGIGDPARLVSSFAGVGSTGDGNNDIIVRGNNPRFIQWKLEGTEIPSPNHFSQEGLTGGPISALNSQLLANSAFYTGAFAPEYGNALSAIFDMRLRNGNNEKREHSFSVGVLGTDITTEGPFRTGGKSSYLINYRYSTLALISNLGILDFGGIPKYQDLSFKVFIPTQNAGSFSFFGLGGRSSISTEYYEPDNEEVVNEEFQQNAQLGVVGLKHLISLTEKSYLSSTISASNNGSEMKSARAFDSSVLQEDLNFSTQNNILRFNTTLNYKHSSRHSFQTGLVMSAYRFNFESGHYDIAHEQFVQSINSTGTASLSQAFVTWKWRATEKLSLVGGVHSQKTSQHGAVSFEPRLSLRQNISKGQAITAGIGIHSNMTSLSNYHTLVYDSDGMSSTPNTSLELLKARHVVLGYENKLSANLFFKIEAYYQQLYDIPIEQGNSSYSLLNQQSEFSDRILVNDGEGRNLGLEITLERYFSDHYYFLITASLFDSKYKAGDAVWRNTRFNGNYIFNGLIGREFAVGKQDNNVVGINTKIAWIGAYRILNIDLQESISQGSVVADEINAFQDKGDDIISLNLAISYRINKSRLSHEIKLDVQNITNHSAVIDYYYNDVNKAVEEINQLPLLPLLSYTLNF